MPAAPSIAVYSAHRHPRLRYVLRVLQDDLGYRFRLISDWGRWEAQEEAYRIVYGGAQKQTDHLALRLPAHSLLRGGYPLASDLETVFSDGIPLFFGVPSGNDVVRYDLLACIFFAVTRFEEYRVASHEFDEHGRFSASASHAHRNGYLRLPVVRMWAAIIAGRLRKIFPDLPPPDRPRFYFQPTYDIDLLWAFRHRGWRGVASGLRDLLTGNIRRSAARFGLMGKPDPYMTLPYLLSLHLRTRKNNDAQPQVFWLLADNADRRDPNPYPTPAEQRQIMRAVDLETSTGIHPSYRSLDETSLIKLELSRLRTIVQKPIERSRQHFLRFQLPTTYRALLGAGIRHDHSMGYADRVGWRAGTNLSFKWYDLEKEEMTGLSIHPFAAMDATLRSYLKLNAEEGRRLVEQLAFATLPYGGPFALLWHNSSFADDYGWAGWRKAYEQLVEFLDELSDPPTPRSPTSDRTDR